MKELYVSSETYKNGWCRIMALVGKYFDESELACHGDNPDNYQAYGYEEGCGCGFSRITNETLIQVVACLS